MFSLAILKYASIVHVGLKFNSQVATIRPRNLNQTFFLMNYAILGDNSINFFSCKAEPMLWEYFDTKRT